MVQEGLDLLAAGGGGAHHGLGHEGALALGGLGEPLRGHAPVLQHLDHRPHVDPGAVTIDQGFGRRVGARVDDGAHGVGLDGPAELGGQGVGAAAGVPAFIRRMAADEAGVGFAHRKAEAALGHAGADQVRPGLGQGLGIRDAVRHPEEAPLVGDAGLAPEPLDQGGPFLGEGVAVVVVQGLVPGPHLVELGLVGAGHDVEAGSAAADVVEGGDHLGRHRRVLQQGVDGGPDLDPRGGLGDGRHQGDRLQGGAPMVGLAAEAAPLAHGHDEVEAGVLGGDGGGEVLLPEAIEGRGCAGDDPAAIGHRQEDAEVPVAGAGSAGHADALRQLRPGYPRPGRRRPAFRRPGAAGA